MLFVNPSKAMGATLSEYQSLDSDWRMLTVLRRGVESEAVGPHDAVHGRHLQKTAAVARGVRLAKELDSFAGNGYRTPEVGLKESACIGVLDALYFSQVRVSGVVEDDVDMSESTFSLSKGLGDLLGMGDVRLDSQNTVGGVLVHEVVEEVCAAGHGDDYLAVLEHNVAESAAKARRCAGN